jgi:hypothetical protein
MPEEISTASTESSTPTDSGAASSVDAATSASSNGVGEPAAQAPTADANAQAAADNQIDIGWTYGDEPEQQASIPENDDDIQGMLGDPALDQARTPGLVNALRSARQAVRESKQEVTQLKQQYAQLDEYGGIEGVTQTMSLVNGMLTNPEQGIGDFLQALHAQAYPSYEQLVNSVITANADYAIQQLQQAGKLPADATQQRAGSIDADTLATIPQHLREIAKSLPAHVLDDLLVQPEEVRNFNLERELKLQQLDSNQRQHEEQRWQQAQQQAYQQGQQAITALGDQYEKAHYSELAKWKPLGPDNDKGNSTIYKMAVEGAFADLLADPKFQQMHNDALALMQNAPLRRLRNEGFSADADERKARQMAAQFNTRFGQILRERVQLLDGVFRDARAYRETQRQEIPERTEISGTSSHAGQNGEPPRNINGKTNPAWLDWMISQLPSRRAQQG